MLVFIAALPISQLQYRRRPNGEQTCAETKNPAVFVRRVLFASFLAFILVLGFLALSGDLLFSFLGMDKHIVGVSEPLFFSLPDFAKVGPIL
jgi:hypothetical protein